MEEAVHQSVFFLSACERLLGGEAAQLCYGLGPSLNMQNRIFIGNSNSVLHTGY